MNRIGYYEEDGKLKMELQEVKPVTKTAAKRIFKISEKPAYLQIFFHRPMSKYELTNIYTMLTEYNVIKFTQELIDKSILEDVEAQGMTWELKCDFQDALDCATQLGNDILFHEGALTLQISDEPTKRMKNWLKRKENRKN